MNSVKAERISLGLCIYCGKKLDRNGIYCLECVNRLNTMRNDINKERKISGLCKTCGKPLDRQGIQCTVCNENQNEHKKNHAIRNAMNNICSGCQRILDREGWMCSRCLAIHKLKGKEKYNQRKLLGLCVRCGEPTDGYTYCLRCRVIRYTGRNKRD